MLHRFYALAQAHHTTGFNGGLKITMFIEFVNENIGWFLALAVIANLLLWSIMQNNVAGANMVSALEMPSLQRKGKSLLIDVNKADDFAKAHIPAAINMPLESFDISHKDIAKHKDNPIILSCQSGNRSIKVAKLLIKGGFSNVNILRGGLMSWTKENLPVTSE